MTNSSTTRACPTVCDPGIITVSGGIWEKKWSA